MLQELTSCLTEIESAKLLGRCGSKRARERHLDAFERKKNAGFAKKQIAFIIKLIGHLAMSGRFLLVLRSAAGRLRGQEDAAEVGLSRPSQGVLRPKRAKV